MYNIQVYTEIIIYQVSHSKKHQMKKKSVFIISLLFCSGLIFCQTNPKKDSIILNWNFDSTDFKLESNFNIADNGYRTVKYSHGDLPRFRSEGNSLTTTPRVSVVSSEGSGNAIQYTLGPQKEGDHKARAEHYLFVANFGKTYISEFSLKLHPGFTPILVQRADGGSAWCCFRQWHQSSPESPPMTLLLKPGTNNVIYTEFLYGTCRGGIVRKSKTSEKIIQLGKWYHFRYEWRIDPGTDNSYCKIWMSENKINSNPDNKDLWCDYKGQIGYTLDGKSESEIEPLSRNIREQQGLYQNSDFDTNAFHAVIYDSIKITEKLFK